MKEKIKKIFNGIKLYFNKDKIEDRLIREKIKNGICPITNEKIETNIDVYSFGYHLFYVKVQKINIPLSNKGKELQNKKTGTFRFIFNILSWNLAKIPLFGGTIIIICFILSLYLIPIWLILDLFLRKKFYGGGIIKLRENGTIYIDKQ